MLNHNNHEPLTEEVLIRQEISNSLKRTASSVTLLCE